MHAVWVFCWQERENKEGPISKSDDASPCGYKHGSFVEDVFQSGKRKGKSLIVGYKYLRGVKTWVSLWDD